MAQQSEQHGVAGWMRREPTNAEQNANWSALSTGALLSVVVGVAYYLGAKLGLALTFQPHPIATLWPPNSILLAALLLAPVRSWWMLLIGAFVAHLTAELQGGVPVAMVLCWFISNSAQALIGAVLLRKLLDGAPRFNRLYDVTLFLLLGALLAPFLASFLDTALVKLIGWGSGTYWQLWRLRFFSNVLTALILVPPIITWSRGIGRRRADRRRLLEAGLFGIVLLAVIVPAFTMKPPDPDWGPALLYAPVPLLIWAAVRFGPRGVSTAILLFALLSIWYAVHGEGPFSTIAAADEALSIQLFLIMVSVPLLTLAAVMKERQQAAAALRESRERLDLILDAAQIGTWDWDIATKRVSWSEQSKQMFGVDAPGAQFAVETAVRAVHPADRERFLLAIEEALKQGRLYELEFRVCDPDGTVRWVLGKGRAMYDPPRRAARMLGINVDITARKHAEEARLALEERFTKAFRSSPDAMAIVRQSDGTVIDVNDRWESMFGYARAELTTHSTSQLYVHPGDRDRFLEQAARTGLVRDFETDLRIRSGEVRRMLLSAEAVEVAGTSCFIAIIRDITAQRAAEREAEDQRQQLVHLTRVAVLGELSGALAHELNQPLTAILSNAQAAQRMLKHTDVDMEQIRDILEDIVHEDKRAGEVIKRLRALLKRGEAQMQSLDLNDVVQDVLELTHADLVNRNISVATELAAHAGHVRGDRVQLEQVMLNLVLNACEAMNANPPADRRLLIRTCIGSNHTLELCVSDRGPGVAPEIVEHLFEPFFTTKEQGLGLGLSISRSIIAVHGGQIRVQNNAEGGASFSFALPLQH